LKIVILSYFSEIKIDFEEILYFVADWDYNKSHTTKTPNFKIQYGGRRPCWQIYFWL